MKVLLIGMDGCYKEVFERGWTPFISQLLKSHRNLEIDTDLISRGWLEIALGEHAIMTKAVYDRPKANGSFDWTKKFSHKDIPDYGSKVKGIWQKLNEKEFSVGIMNVPTTFPAPQVNGFFISGGGGGAPVVESATEELCYPPEILPTLHENDYIVDDRLYELIVEKKLDTVGKILNRLEYKNERRTESFLALNKKYNVDFGFIVYRTASVLAETFFNAESNRCRNSKNKPDDQVLDALRSYYNNFDMQIKKLSEAYPDTELIFVSDHGTTERTHDVNPNALFQEQGLQYLDHKNNLVKNAVDRAKRIIPFWMKSFLKKNISINTLGIGSVNFDPSRTKAFCRPVENWVHGIFINDEERFGGPVGVQEFENIRSQIIDMINAHPDAIEHKIVATTTAPKLGQKFDYFPDIQLSLPNGYLTSNNGSKFISDYKQPISNSTLASIMKGEMFYMKSHSPIASVSTAITEHCEPEDLKGDLTVIHNLIVNIFDKQRTENAK